MTNNESKKDKITSLCVTLIVHALVVLLLVFLGFKYQAPEEESGILLMVGEVELSSGEDSSVSDVADIVEPAPAPEAVPTPSAPEPTPEPPLIAQNIEEAPSLAAEKKKKEEQARKAEEEARKKQQELDAKRAAELAKQKAEADAKAKAEAEARAKAEEEARRKAEEEANLQVTQTGLISSSFSVSSRPNCSGFTP